MSNSNESPEKKRKVNSNESPEKKRKVEGSPLLSWLPDDISISILARASREDHAALALVSKSCRHLVASPDLYKTRSLMGRNETYLYVCLRTPPPDPNPRWYILRRRKEASSDLIPIPSLPCHTPESSSVVVLDWEIYVFGGLIKKGKPTSAVWLLDCRTHTWRSIPSMGVARANAAAGVVDGKIYLLGGCKFTAVCWGEVFDPKTQTWGALPHMPDRKIDDLYIHGSVVRDRKVYAVDETHRTFYYSPSQGLWGRGNRGELVGSRRDWCMIDNLLYCINFHGTIFWCEPDELDWREPEGMYSKEVKGLSSLRRNLSRSRVVHFGEDVLSRWEQGKIKHAALCQQGEFRKFLYDLVDLLPGARLSNSGGNIVLFWDKIIKRDHPVEIWCTEISLERRGGEIWGNIERSNAVMTVNPSLDRYKVLVSDINIGYEEIVNTQVLAFNGKPVKNLKGLAEMVENCEDEYMKFNLDYDQIVVLDTKTAKEATLDMLITHCIPSAYV